MKKVIIGVLGVVVISLAFVRCYKVAQNPLEYGIVMVEGWKHGVAICDEVEGDHEITTQEGEFYMWAENGVLFTVNWGHMNDAEVDILQAMAYEHCVLNNNQ